MYILSQRGDTIIKRDFRGDIPTGTNEEFFRKVKKTKAEKPPMFCINGVNFVHVKKGGLYIVVTSRYNIAPSVTIDLLCRLSNIIKDFCGVITEEGIRKNFVLVYEIIDEMIDFGYP